MPKLDELIQQKKQESHFFDIGMILLKTEELKVAA